MSETTVFTVLSGVLARTPGLSPSDLAEKLAAGLFDPLAPDPEVTRLVLQCEEVLESDVADGECDARVLEIWRRSTTSGVIQAVSAWAEREFP
jgi:hypothetical protein